MMLNRILCGILISAALKLSHHKIYFIKLPHKTSFAVNNNKAQNITKKGAV